MTAAGVLRKFSPAIAELEKAGSQFNEIPEEWPSEHSMKLTGLGQKFAFVTSTLPHDLTGIKVKRALDNLEKMCKENKDIGAESSDDD